jgi:thioredoxin reductase/Pyruvate/2-oxoacid:ferredoxin oxidoreductase delta subunit
MGWTLLLIPGLLIALAAAAVARRRAETAKLMRTLGEIDRAKARGSHRARLQHPVVDLRNCIGCGLCVAACPEDGVLDLVHGQAAVVHGGRCVGHGRCAEACPTGAIAVTLGDLRSRDDIPALTEGLEVVGRPGLFLAGEVTGYALIRTAVAHGASVAAEAGRRAESRPSLHPETGPAPLDLLVVGAGPAGIACSLEARRLGLEFQTIEQDDLGGTVARYPRGKVVMTQPVELPLHGRLRRTTYSKEELVELWRELVARHDLPVRTGVVLRGLRLLPEGIYEAETSTGPLRARCVCLALGRRGTPRKLGVPGEELPKVAYDLMDARSFEDRRILVVGGGDAAVEAAIGLSEQAGNAVALSYRRRDFFRLKARNDARVRAAIDEGRIRFLPESRVLAIGPDAVELALEKEGQEPERLALPNDSVFVMVGGVPPFELLKGCGVSFDPADRAAAAPPAERSTGLLSGLVVTLVLCAGALAFTLAHAAYYGLPSALRPGSVLHPSLRPAGSSGLSFGLAAAALVISNALYLVRRSSPVRILPGSLRGWMIAHMTTGISALLLVLLHSGLAPRDTVGGHTLALLGVVVLTGAVGRYLYAFVPRATGGRVADLDEARGKLAAVSAEWDRGGRGFGERVRREVSELVDAVPWRRSLPSRLLRLVGGQRRLGRVLARLRREGEAEDIPREELDRVLALARRAHRASLGAARYEDLRGLLSSWRYLHRWLALLMVLLATLHVVTAVRYADLAFGDTIPLRWILGGTGP